MRSLRLIAPALVGSMTARCLLAAAAMAGSVALAQDATLPSITGSLSGGGLTGTMPATTPAALPALTPESQPALPGLGGAATAPATAQSFVGVVTGDRVYVRPGPGTEYYELGQLAKGEAVQVVGTRGSWYQILPPASVYGLIARDYLEADAEGKVGTVKGDYIRIRAGSSVHASRADAVLTIVRKGTKLAIVGSADVGATKYYKVVPPEKTYVYLSSQFVRSAPEGTEVKTAASAAGIAADSGIGVNNGGNGSARSDVVVSVETRPVDITETQPATSVAEVPATQRVVVAPVPATSFAPGAYEKFAELNRKTVEEFRKPVLKQDAGGMIEEWKGFLRTDNLPPSVRQAAEARVSAIERILELQKVARESREDSALEQQRKALQDQASSAFKMIEEAERTGPYLAEGILRTSTVVKNAYALVNPGTQRVVAYIEPSAEIDMSIFLDKYVGVRGTTSTPRDADVKVIKPRNATLLPAPKFTTGG